MPARLPDCGTEPLTIRELDWVSHTGATPKAAAENLLGKELPDPEIDQPNPYRRDVVVTGNTGEIVAVISTYLTDAGLWDAVVIYDCGGDVFLP